MIALKGAVFTLFCFIYTSHSHLILPKNIVTRVKMIYKQNHTVENRAAMAMNPIAYSFQHNAQMNMLHSLRACLAYAKIVYGEFVIDSWGIFSVITKSPSIHDHDHDHGHEPHRPDGHDSPYAAPCLVFEHKITLQRMKLPCVQLRAYLPDDPTTMQRTETDLCLLSAHRNKHIVGDPSDYKFLMWKDSPCDLLTDEDIGYVIRNKYESDGVTQPSEVYPDGLVFKSTTAVSPPSPEPVMIMMCMQSYGTFMQTPNSIICIVPQTLLSQNVSSIALECGASSGDHVQWHIRPVAKVEDCLIDDGIAFANKFLGLLAKLNYFMIGCDFLAIIVVIIIWEWRSGKNTKRHFTCAFVCMNIIWMIWRLQETLNWDTNWRSNHPYLCIFTNYVAYSAEAGILYMFACTSLHRYQAVARPLRWRSRSMPRFLDASAIITGILVGIIISTLNLIALLDMGDRHIKQFCSFNNDAANIPLLFIMVVKVLNLGLVFVLPFLVTLVSNSAMFIVLLMAKKKVVRSKNHSKFNWKFLVLSCVIIAFCLAKPATELKLAVETYQNGRLAGRGPGDIIVEGVMWNLTTLAYMINTLAGIKYSPQGKA